MGEKIISPLNPNLPLDGLSRELECKSMSLNYEILSHALFDLELELREGKSWMMIIEESGVANVKSIAEGRIKPTVESWQQLHKAFPDKIPLPQTLDGEVIIDKSVSYSNKKVIF